MKVESFLVASTINVIIAQRLVRQICNSCREELGADMAELAKHLPKEDLVKFFGRTTKIRVYHGVGCKVCRNTGYLGRIGIFEVLEITKGIRKLILEKTDADIIEQAAIAEGMRTMLDDGLEKVAKGLTTIEEVLRATKTESS